MDSASASHSRVRVDLLCQDLDPHWDVPGDSASFTDVVVMSGNRNASWAEVRRENVDCGRSLRALGRSAGQLLE